MMSEIPIYIPCFNNPTYLKNTVEQLLALDCPNLIVLDNVSTYPPMVDYLLEIQKIITVVRLPENIGPHYLFRNTFLFQTLPPHFCLTDPDLEFNRDLPPDFIAQLLDLTEEFKVGKAGFAIDISDAESMVDTDYLINGSYYKIWEWEKRNWAQVLRRNVYKAGIDTTFAVYNRKYFNKEKFYNAVRVAGDFTCKHLPWYKTNRLPEEEELFYRRTSKYSYYLPGDRTSAYPEIFAARPVTLLFAYDLKGPVEQLNPLLRKLIEEIFTHPQKKLMTLLIWIPGIDIQILNSMVTNLVTTTLVEQMIDLSEGEPELYCLPEVERSQWQHYLDQISAVLVTDERESEREGLLPVDKERIHLECISNYHWSRESMQ